MRMTMCLLAVVVVCAWLCVPRPTQAEIVPFPPARATYLERAKIWQIGAGTGEPYTLFNGESDDAPEVLREQVTRSAATTSYPEDSPYYSRHTYEIVTVAETQSKGPTAYASVEIFPSYSGAAAVWKNSVCSASTDAIIVLQCRITNLTDMEVGRYVPIVLRSNMRVRTLLPSSGNPGYFGANYAQANLRIKPYYGLPQDYWHVITPPGGHEDELALALKFDRWIGAEKGDSIYFDVTICAEASTCGRLLADGSGGMTVQKGWAWAIIDPYIAIDPEWEYAGDYAVVISENAVMVPEPGSLPLTGMALLGVGAMAAMRRRRRRDGNESPRAEPGLIRRPVLS